MLGKKIAVSRAAALEFRVPSSKGPRRGGSFAFNVIIRLEAGSPAGGFHAVGEASPRGAWLSDQGRAEYWRLVKEALDRVEGLTLSVRAGRVLRQIAELIAELRATTPCPEVVAGVEGALLDLAAQTAGSTVSRVLGRRSRSVPHTVVINAASPAKVIRRQLRSAPADSTIKLTGLADPESTLDAAVLAAANAGIDRPIWLEVKTPPAAPEAVKLVESIADKIIAGDLPPHVILQQPDDAAAADMTELQTAADRLVPPPHPDNPGVVVMGVATSAAAVQTIADSGVRSVALSPQSLGGALATLAAAEELGSHDHLRLGLTGPPHSSPIGARALADLAAAMPRLDYCTGHQSPTDGAADRDLAMLLAPMVRHLSRTAEGPATPQAPPEYAGRPANRYDIEPLRPLFTGKGRTRSASALLERAAMVRGLDITRLSPSVFLAEHPELPRPLAFTPNTTGWTGAAAHPVTRNKEVTRAVLHDAGVPVPQGASFEADEMDDAVGFALSLGTPVVVKPRNGAHGTGVATDLRTESEVRAAIAALNATTFAGQPFIVETHIPGNDYRLLVVGDQVVSVVWKQPASVVGDGRHSVTDLILGKNRWRLENPHARDCPIYFSDDTRYWLDRQGLTPASVPSPGQMVRLSSAGNIAAGGESIEVLDETHESLLALAVAAVAAIPGLDHAGVDVMGDHRLGTDAHPAAVIEVNSRPATSFNHFPMAGTPRDVSSDIVMRSCVLSGLRPGPPRDTLSVQIDVEGRIRRSGYFDWFTQLARARGLVGSVRRRPEGGLEAQIAGPAYDVWVLTSSAVIGPGRAGVTRVGTTHITDVQPVDRLEVHE